MQPDPEEDTVSGEAVIERAWLDAGRCGDVDKMKQLRSQHPNVLGLDRTVQGEGTSAARLAQTPTFCSWAGFHLDTIGASALHTATWQGRDKIVAYLLGDGLNPDTEDGSGTTPIMLSITHHNLQATRCLFRDRVAIQRNLLMDCREEHANRNRRAIDLIQLFLRFGADVNKRCRGGKSAMHLATTDDSYEISCLLIRRGADINAQDEDGKTPLHHSIQSKSLQVTNLLLLLLHRANLGLSDNVSTTPLQLAIDRGEDFAGAVLMTAIDEKALPIMKFLLEEGYVTVDHQNSFGETPMYRAQRHGRGDSFPSHSRRASGDSCLHYAARYSTPDELQRLLHWCQQIGVTEEDGTLAKLLACINSSGDTALFVAATSTSNSLDDRNSTGCRRKAVWCQSFSGGEVEVDYGAYEGSAAEFGSLVVRVRGR